MLVLAGPSASIRPLLVTLAGTYKPGWSEDVLISAHATVIDGDTLAPGPIRIRLKGIDAPEMG
jgi:endonuclease YncB( thermonuclease family)